MEETGVEALVEYHGRTNWSYLIKEAKFVDHQHHKVPEWMNLGLSVEDLTFHQATSVKVELTQSTEPG